MLFRAWSTFVVGLLSFTEAAAHQQKAALTEILVKSQQHVIEVYHRVYIHDAEHAIKHLLGKRGDIISSAETQALFASYLVSQFKVENLKGQILDFPLLGYEVEGKFFYVYQERIGTTDLKGLRISQTALQEIWPEQQNLVNIDRLGSVSSLQFTRGDDQKSLRFALPQSK